MVAKVFLLATFTLINCFILVPERGNVTKWSPKYFHYVRMYVSRISRRSPYYLNLEAHIKQGWANNVSVDIILYEYLHNEYRRSFVEIHNRACDLVHRDLVVGQMLKNIGINCPATAGEYVLNNLTLPMPNLKFEAPFFKFRADIEITQSESKELMAKGYLNVVIKAK
ncbi:hypothetical protein evm_012181 [Chilo suppressalis]|nr:hypothetical protein evm_012181 [Chilo suppressalis]